MIYCIPEKDYPTKEDWRSEELTYKDENDFEWRIARVENGFMIKYFGDEYFKEKTFECDLPNGKHVKINNTNCIFIQSTDFEIFYIIREIIKLGYTDDIWETLEEMFTERLSNDEGVLESEIIEKG